MAIDKIFNATINKAKNNVKLPELKGGMFGVKAETAQMAVKDAVTETAKRVGDEILATYNRVITNTLPDGSLQKTTLGFNEITQETIKNVGKDNEFVSRYVRTTPRGTYEVYSVSKDKVTRTKFTSPEGKAREKVYVAGKPFRAMNPDDVLVLEERHNAIKGRIINHEESRSLGRDYDNSVYNWFEDGSIETTNFKAGRPIGQIITLPTKECLKKDLVNNITICMKRTSNDVSWMYYNPYYYHINPESGAVSFAKVEKCFDEFGRDTRKVSYEFPSGIKNAEMNYAMDNQRRPQFISGFLETDKLGKVDISPFEIKIDGKTADRLELAKSLEIKNPMIADNKEVFEALLKREMSEIGVPKEFIPQNMSWERM